MIHSEAVKLAIEALRSNKLRIFLTMIGVMSGALGAGDRVQHGRPAACCPRIAVRPHPYGDPDTGVSAMPERGEDESKQPAPFTLRHKIL